jgi:hypothetical protein
VQAKREPLNIAGGCRQCMTCFELLAMRRRSPEHYKQGTKLTQKVGYRIEHQMSLFAVHCFCI